MPVPKVWAATLQLLEIVTGRSPGAAFSIGATSDIGQRIGAAATARLLFCGGRRGSRA